MKKLSLILTVLVLIGCSAGNKYTTDGVTKRKVHKKFTTDQDQPQVTVPFKTGKVYYLVCSYYGAKFHGRQTSNGEIFDMYKFTCAHKTMPFDTVLKVTNEDNGRSVIVRVNDRGPFIAGRDLDLSYAAAREIGMVSDGVKTLRVELMK